MASGLPSKVFFRFLIILRYDLVMIQVETYRYAVDEAQLSRLGQDVTKDGIEIQIPIRSARLCVIHLHPIEFLFHLADVFHGILA